MTKKQKRIMQRINFGTARDRLKKEKLAEKAEKIKARKKQNARVGPADEVDSD